MNDLHIKLKRAAADIRLTSDERAALRACLLEEMHAHPAPPPITPSPYTAAIFHLYRVAIFAAALLVVVLGAGGTVYAAQGSLPGDVLYPIKIHVTEAIETALAVTPTQKAQVQAALASRRLEEAQALAAQGRLNASTTQALTENFAAHAQAAQALATSLQTSDPEAAAQISIGTAADLTANSEVLEDLGDRSTNDDTRRATRALGAAVRARVAAIPAIASTTINLTEASNSPHALAAPGASSSTPSSAPLEAATTFEAHARKALAQVREALGEAQDALDASTTLAAQAQLGSIAAKLGAGDAQLQRGDTAQAYAQFAQALGAALQLQAILNAAQRLQESGTPLRDIQIHADENGSAAIEALPLNSHHEQKHEDD